jgi:aspartate aminotransferase-like enzyme
LKLNFVNFTGIELYDYLADRHMLIYPGKLTTLETFRLGSIGEVYPKDCELIMKYIREFLTEKKISIPVKYD